MTTIMLPNFIEIKSFNFGDNGYAYYKKEGGSVLLGEESVFSTLVKIGVERATSNDKYVSLRFCYSNRYWARQANGKFIVAESDQPEEDTTKPSCTLFEAVKVDDNGVFYLTHVGSGGRVLIDGPTMALYTESNPGDEEGYLSFVDWNSLVKLPAHAAFKGDNENYLLVVVYFLLFMSGDPNYIGSNFKVELRADGYVRIKTEGSGLFWRVAGNDLWIMAEGDSSSDADVRTHFWPVKIDDNSIALRSRFNNLFCHRFSPPGTNDTVWASASTITKQAILQVQELVMGRKIYNVRYQMEYARIFNEAPYVGGSSTLINDHDEEASMAVVITYEDSKSYTFSRGLSLTAGVTTSFQTGVPFIAQGKIEVSFEINTTLQWDTTTTTTVSVNASGTVPVPGRSRVTVDYVGTRGTCNIPYTYTQEDKSSTDGQTIYTDLYDGIYNGVSYYNFNFHVRSTQAL